jgi:hypothetical protein
MSVADKLQIKPGHRVAVLHAPQRVDIGLADSPTADPTAAVTLLVFVTNRAELDDRGGALVDAARRDALAWIAYPNGMNDDEPPLRAARG